MADGNNLLVQLHRWVHWQDENFTTEALVHLLQHLLDNEPQIAVRLLKRLTKGVMDVSSEEAKGVQVSTQVTTAEGRPDVEIRTSDHLVFIEAKVESDLGWQQLERYRRQLRGSGVGKTTLILLTRYPVEIPLGGEVPDAFVRWHEIADWLIEERTSDALTDAVSLHVIEQFLGFLSARGMTMKEVGWEMVPGVRELCGFLAMLAEAASACKVSVKPRSKLPEFIGFYMENKRYWVGFDCDEVGHLYAITNKFGIDLDSAAKLGKGELLPVNWVPGKQGWMLTLDLRTEEVHFFARSRASQMQCLEKFIREFLDAAKTIESADQTDPSTPEPDDESDTDDPHVGG